MMESVTCDAPRALEPSRAGTRQRDAKFRATLEPSSGTRAMPPPAAPSFAGRGADEARQAPGP